MYLVARHSSLFIEDSIFIRARVLIIASTRLYIFLLSFTSRRWNEDSLKCLLTRSFVNLHSKIDETGVAGVNYRLNFHRDTSFNSHRYYAHTIKTREF